MPDSRSISAKRLDLARAAGEKMASRDSASLLLTVVVLALNEAKRLPRCLAAIPREYPVMVVDSGSTDGTQEIARSHGCSIIGHPWPGFADQRNFALEACGLESKWVLFVDADEVYTPEFFDWFETNARERDDFDVGQVSLRIVFRNVPLYHAPGYPIYHPRLVRRGHARFLPNHTGHGEMINPEAKAEYVDIPYLHYWFDGDLLAWMAKHLRLASQEAFMTMPGSGAPTLRASLSLIFIKAPIRTPLRFLYHYVIRGGFIDGGHGLAYSLMYAWYEFTKGLIRLSARLGRRNQ